MSKVVKKEKRFKLNLSLKEMVALGLGNYQTVQKAHINAGNYYEKVINDLLQKQGKSIKTILPYKHIKGNIPIGIVMGGLNGFLADTSNNYYIPSVKFLTPQQNYVLDAIFISGGIIYLIEMKKKFNIDTTNSSGVYNKLTNIYNTFSSIYNVRKVFVGLSDNTSGITKCDMHRKLSTDSKLLLLTGQEFYKKLNIKHATVIKKMKVTNPSLEIIENFKQYIK